MRFASWLLVLAACSSLKGDFKEKSTTSTDPTNEPIVGETDTETETETGPTGPATPDDVWGELWEAACDGDQTCAEPKFGNEDECEEAQPPNPLTDDLGTQELADACVAALDATEEYACGNLPEAFDLATGIISWDDLPDACRDWLPAFTHESFVREFEHEYCETFESCTGQSCDLERGQPIEPPADGCTLDLDMAENCLEGSWTCQDGEWIEAPDACVAVLVCEPTETTDPSTETGCGSTPPVLESVEVTWIGYDFAYATPYVNFELIITDADGDLNDGALWVDIDHQIDQSPAGYNRVEYTPVFTGPACSHTSETVTLRIDTFYLPPTTPTEWFFRVEDMEGNSTQEALLQFPTPDNEGNRGTSGPLPSWP